MPAAKIETVELNKNRKESVFVPRGTKNEDENEFVSVGGKNYLLPKGKSSSVPWYVAEEMRRSDRAKRKRIAEIERRTANK